MSTGHKDEAKRAESDRIARDLEEFLKAGRAIYSAKIGETAISVVTPLNSRQGKRATHILRMAKKVKNGETNDETQSKDKLP